MKFILSGEFDKETNVGILRNKYDNDFADYFKNKHYSDGLKEIFIVLVCRPVNFKQRKKYDQKEGVLYFDVMLNYNLMVSSDLITGEVHFFESFRQIIPFIEKLNQKINDLKVQRFKDDFENFLSQYI